MIDSLKEALTYSPVPYLVGGTLTLGGFISGYLIARAVGILRKDANLSAKDRMDLAKLQTTENERAHARRIELENITAEHQTKKLTLLHNQRMEAAGTLVSLVGPEMQDYVKQLQQYHENQRSENTASADLLIEKKSAQPLGWSASHPAKYLF